jgi:hypothetical protein
MDADLYIRGKYTFRLNEQKLILVKKAVESRRHVVMKALLWGLYLPAYPGLRVEVPVGYKYKPDLVQMDADGPLFWAEAGRVGSEKLRRLLKRFPRTHFAMAAWGRPLAAIETRIRRQTCQIKRKAPVDVIVFPKDADVRFIDSRGRICIDHEDLDWQRIT